MVGVPIPPVIPPGCPFGPFNLPYGIFSTASGHGQLGSQRRAGVAIGEYVLELHHLAESGMFDSRPEIAKTLRVVWREPVLNSFAAFETSDRRWVRSMLIDAITNPQSCLVTDTALNAKAFVPIEHVTMHLPMKITDYTDSFSSLIHAQNALLPLGLDLPPAFTQYPLGYNGRVSSIFVSGHPIHRPSGFFIKVGDSEPTFQTSQEMDFEIEMGAFISKPVPHGSTVDAKAAADHIFGYVLHNDWSARDIQQYEMPPLGPMHSKGYVTTISPWVVTVEALESATAGPPTSNSTPIHPSMLADDKNHGVYDIEYSATVARNGDAPVEIVRTSYVHSYWSVPQMLAYQSSGGWGINTGDLVASGTISSPAPEVKKGLGTYGCLLEVLAQKHELPAVGGRPMSWLEDGDRLCIEGSFRTADGSVGGFGGLSSMVVPGPAWPSRSTG